MNILEAYDTAIDTEKRLSNLYYRLSNLFKNNTEIHNFWTSIADHEKTHTETLTLSKGYILWSHPSVKQEDIFSLNRSDITGLEGLNLMIRDYERKLKKEIPSLQGALGVLLKIENSELNHLYNRLIRLSGVKLPQKPENVPRSIHEHEKIIKAFLDKHYRGSIPTVSIEDFADTRPAPATDMSGREDGVTGKIAEVVPDMSYGFIDGEDGERYLFLPEDISQGGWEDAEINKSVEFSVAEFPWGFRAFDIRIL